MARKEIGGGILGRQRTFPREGGENKAGMRPGDMSDPNVVPQWYRVASACSHLLGFVPHAKTVQIQVEPLEVLQPYPGKRKGSPFAYSNMQQPRTLR